MEFKEIVQKRYAAKAFNAEKKLPQKLVDELIEYVRLAPSGFNLQPWIVKIITDQPMKDKIMAASWNQPQVGTASHLLVFCANNDIEGLIKKLETHAKKANMPQEKIDAYLGMIKGWAKNHTLESATQWAQKQVFLAMANALNGATALGFESCPMEGFDPIQVHALLKLPKNLVVTALVPIGYATDTPRTKSRFSTQEILA